MTESNSRVINDITLGTAAGNVPVLDSGAKLASAVIPTSITGKVVQVVHTVTSASTSGTTTMPADNTIPQNTEGVEFITRAITPTNASNKLLIQFNLYVTASSSTDNISYALFQDTTANALASGIEFSDSATAFAPLALTHYMTAGTTSATTFKVRAGTHSAGTTYLNRTSSGDMHGGVMSSSITIWELTA